MRTMILISLLGIAFPVSFAHGQPQQDITMLLTLFEIDNSHERRAVNKFVMVFPKDQGVATGFTNGDGQIKFQFNSTESVTFRVGSLGDQIRVQPISGRLSQETSFLLDSRMRSDGICQTCSATAYERGVAAPAPTLKSFQQVTDMHQLLDDLLYQSGGRVMKQQSREFANSLRQQIIQITTPRPDSGEFERQALAESRRTLLGRLDDMLASPWKMKASFSTLPRGAQLGTVDPNGPAGLAGIIPGDIVMVVDGTPVTRSTHDLKWLIGNAQSNQVILQVQRGNQNFERTVSLVK